MTEAAVASPTADVGRRRWPALRLRSRLLVLTVAILVPLSGLVLLAERHALRRSAEAALRAHVEARLAGDGADRCAADPARFTHGHRPPPPPGGDQEADGPPGQPRGLGPPGGPGAPPEWRGSPGSPGPPPARHAGPAWKGRPPPDHRERFPDDDHEPPPGHISVYVYDAEGRSGDREAPPFPPDLRGELRAPVLRAFSAEGQSGRELWQRVGPGGPACAYLLARRTEPALRVEWLGPWLPPLAALGLAIAVGLIPVVRRIRRLSAAVRRTARAGYGERTSLGEFGDDEIGELALAFDEAARMIRAELSAQAAREQALRDFLANTTHDVMTPLTALQGHLAALQEAARAPVGARPPPELVGAAIDEAHYMASLMHNLAVAARLEAGAPQLVVGLVDLGRLVERVVARHRLVAGQHEVSLECGSPDRPCFASGDETLLEQAVSNLVYNALRYNHAGGHVAVVVEHVPPVAPSRAAAASNAHVAGERFALRVLDDGPGIAPLRLADLVARRVRGEEARSRHPDGQGLGLSITTQVAAAHGFSLTFETPPEGGLSATLEGPTEAPP
jgi:signal transduction histidine kinase